MLGLAKLKEQAAIKEAKKIEREKRRKEKEKEKLRQKRLAHKKKMKSKQNKKYYAKIRKAQLAERDKIGDEYSYFTILLTKNRKRIERIGAARWKTDAYKIFNAAIEKNQSETKFPVKFVTTDKDSNKYNSIVYEIVMIRKAKNDEEAISKLRNKDGKLVDNVILDKNQHIIVDKHEWLIEETFNVYGYHPIRDRKTYDFILNNIVLKDIIDKYDIRTIFTFRNKVVIKYIDDFDFITCKNPTEANRLATQLEKNIPKHYKKNIIYIGEIKKSLIPDLIDKMVKKTGWTRQMCGKGFS